MKLSLLPPVLLLAAAVQGSPVEQLRVRFLSESDTEPLRSKDPPQNTPFVFDPLSSKTRDQQEAMYNSRIHDHPLVEKMIADGEASEIEKDDQYFDGDVTMFNGKLEVHRQELLEREALDDSDEANSDSENADEPTTGYPVIDGERFVNRPNVTASGLTTTRHDHLNAYADFEPGFGADMSFQTRDKFNEVNEIGVIGGYITGHESEQYPGRDMSRIVVKTWGGADHDAYSGDNPVGDDYGSETMAPGGRMHDRLHIGQHFDHPTNEKPDGFVRVHFGELEVERIAQADSGSDFTVIEGIRDDASHPNKTRTSLTATRKDRGRTYDQFTAETTTSSPFLTASRVAREASDLTFKEFIKQLGIEVTKTSGFGSDISFGTVDKMSANTHHIEMGVIGMQHYKTPTKDGSTLNPHGEFVVKLWNETDADGKNPNELFGGNTVVAVNKQTAVITVEDNVQISSDQVSLAAKNRINLASEESIAIYALDLSPPSSPSDMDRKGVRIISNADVKTTSARKIVLSAEGLMSVYEEVQEIFVAPAGEPTPPSAPPSTAPPSPKARIELETDDGIDPGDTDDDVPTVTIDATAGGYIGGGAPGTIGANPGTIGLNADVIGLDGVIVIAAQGGQYTLDKGGCAPTGGGLIPLTCPTGPYVAILFPLGPRRLEETESHDHALEDVLSLEESHNQLKEAHNQLKEAYKQDLQSLRNEMAALAKKFAA